MMASQLCGRLLVRGILPSVHCHTTSVCQLTRHSSSCSPNLHRNHYYPNKIPSITSHRGATSIINNVSSRQSPSATVNLVEKLQQRLSKMSVSPLPSGLYLSPQTNVEYKLPAHLGNELTQKIIVDPAVSNAVRKCPTVVPGKAMEDPRRVNRIMDIPPVRHQSEKHARVTNIIMIRKKKMNNHKLKKLRKRMQFQTFLILSRRKKKKRLAWEARLETYKFKDLTDEIIERHLAKIRCKREYLEGYYRALAGLEKKSTAKPKEKIVQPDLGPITPTPILPPQATRRL